MTEFTASVPMWLIIASAIIWLGLGGYMAFLGAVQKRLARIMRQIEALRDDQQK